MGLNKEEAKRVLQRAKEPDFVKDYFQRRQDIELVNKIIGVNIKALWDNIEVGEVNRRNSVRKTIRLEAFKPPEFLQNIYQGLGFDWQDQAVLGLSRFKDSPLIHLYVDTGLLRFIFHLNTARRVDDFQIVITSSPYLSGAEVCTARRVFDKAPELLGRIQNQESQYNQLDILQRAVDLKVLTFTLAKNLIPEAFSFKIGDTSDHPDSLQVAAEYTIF